MTGLYSLVMNFGLLLDNRSMRFCTVTCLLGCLWLAGCSSSGGGSDDSANTVDPVITPNLVEIPVGGIAVDLGNFDPAPTVDGNGNFWMSYSHVSLDASGLKLIETRLATSADAGASWSDAGLSINPAMAFAIAPNTVAWAQEVSRLVYNPHALAVGADPWILLWHRYLSVLNGVETERLFDNGWIALKSGATATTLGGERKLFSGSLYNNANDVTIGPPEVRLHQLDPSLNDCVAFTEPGLLPKPGGIYVSLLCATVSAPGRIILLACDHFMNNCAYRGTLIDGSEAAALDDSFDNFSASELVSVGGADYLVVTPSAATIYRGCVVYRITDLDQAAIERDAGAAKPAAIFEPNGDFNGACGYVEGLTGSGLMISEAFFRSAPTFRIFTTGYDFQQ